MLYHLMPSNINRLKRNPIEQGRSSSLKIKCRIARTEADYSSPSLILWRTVKKSTLPFLWNFNIFNCYCVSLINTCISLLSSLLAIFLLYFTILKQTTCHNHENTTQWNLPTREWPPKMQSQGGHLRQVFFFNKRSDHRVLNFKSYEPIVIWMHRAPINTK